MNTSAATRLARFCRIVHALTGQDLPSAIAAEFTEKPSFANAQDEPTYSSRTSEPERFNPNPLQQMPELNS